MRAEILEHQHGPLQGSASQPPAAQQVFPAVTVLQVTTKVCGHSSSQLPNCMTWVPLQFGTAEVISRPRLASSARKMRLNKVTRRAIQQPEKQVERLEDAGRMGETSPKVSLKSNCVLLGSRQNHAFQTLEINQTLPFYAKCSTNQRNEHKCTGNLALFLRNGSTNIERNIFQNQVSHFNPFKKK